MLEKKIVPASLNRRLLARALAAPAASVDLLVDFPRSATQLAQLEKATKPVLCAVHVQGVGGSTPSGSAALAEAVVRSMREGGRVAEVAAGRARWTPRSRRSRASASRRCRPAAAVAAALPRAPSAEEVAAEAAAAEAAAEPPPRTRPLVLLLGAEGVRDELCCASRIGGGCCGRAT